MNKPIYTVFALIDGESIQIGNATDKLLEANKIAFEYYCSYKKTRPLKIVKSFVQFEVVETYCPFKVRVIACSKIYWCHTKKEYLTLTNKLLLEKIPFEVYSYSYGNKT